MGAGKFTKTDSDLLGLLQGNRRRASRQIESAVKEEKTDRLSVEEQLKQEAEELRETLLSDIENVQGQIDYLSLTLNGDIEASVPGLELVEQIRLAILALPERIEETYSYAMELNSENIAFQKTIDSFIRRGYLNDPGSGDPIFGIAVGQNLSFTASEITADDGLTYYELDPTRNRLGLYTATGWQFWIDGAKIGWFDSDERQLHVPEMIVDNMLNLGGGWSITAVGGFGIKYTG